MESARILRARSRSRHRAEHCSMLPSHLLSKLLLHQAKQLSAVFRPLSFNILREICSYLSFTPSLAAHHSCQVFTLDLCSMSWQPLGPPIRQSFSKWRDGYNAVLIGSAQVFICGGVGEKGDAYTARKCALIVNQEGEVRVESMLRGRYSHTIRYVEVTASVCVFGGFLHESSSLSSAESFSLVQGRWKALPDMLRIAGRSRACQHQSTIYLFDGELIEAFSVLLCSYFTPNIQLPVLDESLFLVYEDVLCVISRGQLLKWDLNKSLLVQQLPLTQQLGWRSGDLIRKDNWAYWRPVLRSGKSSYLCLDLNSAEVVHHAVSQKGVVTSSR